MQYQNIPIPAFANHTNNFSALAIDPYVKLKLTLLN